MGDANDDLLFGISLGTKQFFFDKAIDETFSAHLLPMIEPGS